MDTGEQIKQFQELIEKQYHGPLLEQARKGNYFLVIDFTELSRFDPALADVLLEQPEEVIKAAELAIEQFDLPLSEKKPFAVRIAKLPDSQQILIRNIRSHNLGKLLKIVGTVRQKSDVRPQVTTARFECPSCGNVIPILQLDNRFKEPNRCGCGRKGKFRMIGKELVDAQGLVLEETAEDLEGGEQPKRMNVFLKNDLVSPLSEKKTNPGSKVIVTGVVKEVPVIMKSGAQSTRFDLMIEANYVDTTEEDYSDLTITEEEKELFQRIANEPGGVNKVVQSLAPNIYGHDRIKQALCLQLMGGVRKKRDDGSITRGDIHILLIGDPGAGKSQMLKRITQVSPKVRYVSGKGASGAGLSAAVVKDEFLNGWSLEAGALVLAHKGMLLLDELDKMSKDDASALHEGLEQQTISIAKANIQATLRCETSVLAAANPKFGRFDPYDLVANQIDMPPTLINRFDLIFPIKDLPDAGKDERMARFILTLHRGQDAAKAEIDTPLLRKYFAYAKRNIFPALEEAAVDELQQYFLKLRSQSGGDKAPRTIPISARQLEALVRLTEASARLRLSQKATQEDAKSAVDLLDYCLKQVAFDEETGTLDIDRITSTISASQRNKISIIKEIVNDLESKVGRTIPLEDLIAAAKEKNVSEEDVEDTLQKLKRSGDLFEPRRGFISKVD